MQKKSDYTFPTGSRYSGSYNKHSNNMNGFGVYTFPDGSEYRGYLKNGKFNGYGRLKLAPPSKFIFRGMFENGELVQIEDMFFADGLRFEGEIVGDKLNCSKWKYCTEGDRRYSDEIRNELEAIGPNAYVTRERPARDVPFNSYDTEEGIYKPSTGFIMNIPAPFFQNRFVACKLEREWITRNCRHGPNSTEDLDLVKPPNLRSWMRILETNINTNLEAVGAGYTCDCQRVIERIKLLKELKAAKEPKKDYDSATGDSYPHSPSYSSCSSMKENSMELRIIDKCLDNLKKSKWDQPRNSDLPKISKLFTMRDPSI